MEGKKYHFSPRSLHHLPNNSFCIDRTENRPPCIVRSLAQKSAPALQPTRAGEEWMGMLNLRRQLRLWACGQRVRGSQSRLKPAPQSPLINQLLSPSDPEENLGRVIVAFCGRFGVRRLRMFVIFVSVIGYFKVILIKSEAS
ncbi:hypothetical protein CDAR_109981 [Caerostris darwini]|uniref:Uncharacterized protein n=1 Tax=Caerostris darwini TaxID=1538125 RepID=A0AAV4P0E8_9ARAC|nr:hypothetical protein CDAR_109981 [Caerostris darwini]